MSFELNLTYVNTYSPGIRSFGLGSGGLLAKDMHSTAISALPPVLSG